MSYVKRVGGVWSDNGGLTQDEVAALLGISRRRVQQLEARAIAKLRAALLQFEQVQGSP